MSSAWPLGADVLRFSPSLTCTSTPLHRISNYLGLSEAAAYSSPAVKSLKMKKKKKSSDTCQRKRPRATFCNEGSWLKDRRPHASTTATSIHVLLQPWRRASAVAVEKLPPDQAELPTNHKMQIHRKLQVNLLLGLPSFQKTPTTKASTAPKPLKISLHYITPLPSVTKAENKQEKTQETSQEGKHGKCTSKLPLVISNLSCTRLRFPAGC